VVDGVGRTGVCTHSHAKRVLTLTEPPQLHLKVAALEHAGGVAPAFEQTSLGVLIPCIYLILVLFFKLVKLCPFVAS
jgi:hypothetical protein